MRKSVLYAAAALTLIGASVAGSAAAQTEFTPGENINTVDYNGFSFTFDSALAPYLNINRTPADPVDVPFPGGPYPAATTFTLYDVLPFTESDLPVGTVTFYAVSDAPGYPAEAEVTALQNLLAARPALADAETLPYLPTIGASQFLHAREEYFDTLGFSGIAYLTGFRQDVGESLADDFSYTFQGISQDGQWVVSAVFNVTAPGLPTEYDANLDYAAFEANYETYVTELRASLNAAQEADFTPSFDLIRQVIATLVHYDVRAMGGMGMIETPQVLPAITAMPAAEATAAVIGDAGPLEGSWTLVSYGATDAQTAVAAEAPVTIAFTGTGINGRACNTFNGSFSFSNDTLTVNPLISTLIGCPEPAASQEIAVFGALQTASTFAINGDTLTISYPEGVLTFTRTVSTLEGSWTLASYGAADAQTPVAADAPVSIAFTGTELSGRACNTFGGSFSATADTLTVDQVISTLVACAEPAMSQENTLFNALQSATGYAINGDTLTISYAEGVLTFTRAASA